MGDRWKLGGGEMDAIAKCTLDGNNIRWEFDLSLLPDGDALGMAVAAADLINHVADLVDECGLNKRAFIRDSATIISRELSKPTAELTGKSYKLPSA